jgi:soluble lytic murein transglycosylase
MAAWSYAVTFALVASALGTKAATPSVTSTALQAQLAAREQEVNALKSQLELFSDAQDYARAEALGIHRAVRATGLPERQQKRIAAAIVREARKNGLDPLLVTAVIRVESSFNNYAISSVGARGLMQVMPETGGWLLSREGQKLRRIDHLFDYELNVELGTKYLAQLIRRFGGKLESALLAYNVGPTAARRILAEREQRLDDATRYPNKVLTELRKLGGTQTQELAQAAKVTNKG